MPRNRFQAISAFLHLAGNSDYNLNDPNHDRLYKVRAVIKYFVDRFKSVYMPNEFVCIDEELLLWKDNSLSSSTQQTRDNFLLLNSFVFMKQVGINGTYLFIWGVRGY